MKKLNLAIIGQGRSGKDIHGRYYRSDDNEYFNVKYVIDEDEHRRCVAEEIYPGCKTFSDYHELSGLGEIAVRKFDNPYKYTNAECAFEDAVLRYKEIIK